MNVKDAVIEYKKKIDSEILKYFDEKISIAKKTGEYSTQTLEILKEYTLRGGKRLRPALIHYSYKCFKNDDNPEILRLGVAVELVQNFLLIHDDLIDNDDIRRGKPSVHKICEKQHSNQKIGESVSIIIGDTAICLANELVAELNIEAEKIVKIISVLNRLTAKVNYGQELDTISNIKNISKEELLMIHKLKTSSYTIEIPLLIGAIMADADEKSVKALKDYAMPAGQVFQLKDDILGLFGDEKKLGKPIGSDLRENKKTLLMINAKKNADQKDLEVLEKILGNLKITKDDVMKVREIVKKTGSLKESDDLIDELSKKAIESLDNSEFNEEGKEFLLELLIYLKERNY